MINLNKLEQKRKELLTNFSEEELIEYIQQLTEKYYSSFVNNEVEVHNNTMKYLEEVLSIYEDKYPQLNNFINFCLVRNINKILNENYSSDVTLNLINESEEEFFSENPFQPLINAFYKSKEAFHKDKKIRELETENRHLKEMLNNGKY